MSDTDIDPSRIGPETTLTDMRIPPHVGAGLADLFGADERIETGGEWVAVMRRSLAPSIDGVPDEDDLCHDDDGAHTVAIDDESHSFVCVVDPLIVPFLRSAPARIESKSPLEAETVTIDVAENGVDVSPGDAVLSLGVAHGPNGDGDGDGDIGEGVGNANDGGDEAVSPSAVYEAICPYTHAFATPGEYERWDERVDAATTSLSVESGVAVARGLSRTLFQQPGAV